MLELTSVGEITQHLARHKSTSRLELGHYVDSKGISKAALVTLFERKSGLVLFKKVDYIHADLVS
jgi:hypothetical protein